MLLLQNVNSSNVHSSSNDDDTCSITFTSTTSLLLHSANFFEHTRIRSRISAYLSSQTQTSNDDVLAHLLPALLLLPREYLDRNLRRSLVGRVAGISGATSEEAEAFLLAFTKDDLGSPLVSLTHTYNYYPRGLVTFPMTCTVAEAGVSCRFAPSRSTILYIFAH